MLSAIESVVKQLAIRSVASWLANFGKSIGYSTKDLLAEVAPNTTQIVEDASDQLYEFRDFISEYKAKAQTVVKQLNYTELQKQADDIISNTINDIKTGNFAAPRDSLDDIFGGADIDFDTEDYTTSDDQNADSSVQVRKLNISTDAKATAKATIESNMMVAETLEKSAKAQMKAQVNTAKAIMDTTNNIGMIAVNKLGASISVTNKRLDQINSNVVALVKFMNENQSKVNQAQLNYLESANAYMKIQLEMIDPKRKSKSTAVGDFLKGGSFSLPAYIKGIKENIGNNQSVAELQLLLGMGSMMGSMTGMVSSKPSDLIRPTQFLMNMAMKKLIPKKVQNAITRLDDLIPQALMGGVSTLSDMRNDAGLRGMLGSIFGMGVRKQNSFKIGNYYKGAIPWDGKSKRALEVVIPHYLALIEENTQNIPKISGTRGAEFYDYDTGTFKSDRSIRNSLKTRTTDAFRQGTYESLNFFEDRFKISPRTQEKAKEIMWKHMQPMIFGTKTLPGEDDLTHAARAYAKDLEALELNPMEISKLVIYFKASVTKLRQYMKNLQLTESEQELFNRRETDDFGYVRGGFYDTDLGNIMADTDLAKKQARDKKKAEESSQEIKNFVSSINESVFASRKEKNKKIENFKYHAREGAGSIHFRNKAATNVEAAGLGLVNLISGYESIDTTNITSAIDSVKRIYSKNKYDHLTVDDVIAIMRRNGYNPDQYDFITSDESADKDGPFLCAVLKFRYGRIGCLRVVKRRNVVYDEKSKKYVIKSKDSGDILVEKRDKDADLQPPEGSEFHAISNTEIPRNSITQYILDQNMIESEGVIQEEKQETLRDKLRNFVNRKKEPTNPITPAEVNPDPGALSTSSPKKSESKKPEDESLGHGPGNKSSNRKRKSKNEPFEEDDYIRAARALIKARRRMSNTNFDASARSREKNRAKDTKDSIEISMEELNKVANELRENVAAAMEGGNEKKNTLWNRIKAKIGMNRQVLKRAGAGAIIGSVLLPGGILGSALIGAGLGIATSGFDFKRFMFGSKMVDEEGRVHVEKTGVIGQWANMLQSEGKGMLSESFDSIKREVSAYAKAQFAPVVEAFKSPDGKSLVSKTMVETIQNVGNYVMDIVTHPMQSLNNGMVKMTGLMLRTMTKAGSAAIKAGLKGTIWAASKPAQLIGDIWSSRHSENPLRFIKNVRGARKQRKRAGRRAKFSYIGTGLLGNLKDSAGVFKETKSLTAARERMASNKTKFFDDKYQQAQTEFDTIRAKMESMDPTERMEAVEALLPKYNDGYIKDESWNALKREDGSIDPADLDAYIRKNKTKLLNSKEQALAGLSNTANYTKEKLTSKRKAKFNATISKFNRKDSYQFKKLTDKEFEKRKTALLKYADKDAEGNVTDDLLKRAIENKEDLEKYINNTDAFAAEIAERDRIKAAEEAKAKAETRQTNFMSNQLALSRAIVSSIAGRVLHTDVSLDSDAATAIENETNSIVTSNKDDAKEKEADKATIAKQEADKAKSAKAEADAYKRRADQVKANAAEAEAVQAQGRNKVVDENVHNAEDDREGDNTATIAGSSDEEDEKESGLGILGKIMAGAGAIVTVGALLKSEAGQKLISTLGSVIGGALNAIGSTVIDWAKNGLNEIATSAKNTLASFVPGVKNEETQKEISTESLAQINPDYVANESTVTVDENGNEVVSADVNTARQSAIPNLARRGVLQGALALTSPAYAKGAKAVAGQMVHFGKSAANFVIHNKSAIGKGVKLVGKGAGFVLDKVTDHIPVVKTIKKIGKGVGKGASAISKATTGKTIGNNVKAVASKVASAGKDKALSALESIKGFANTVIEKLAQNKSLQSLLKKVKSSSLIQTIEKYLSEFFTKIQNALGGGKNKSLSKMIEEGAQKFLGSTAGQVIKTAAVVVTGVWSAASGALDAANLFMVNEDDVDVGMRTVSAIINLMVDFIPVAGPLFDFFSTVAEAIGFPNFKRELAERIYELVYTITGGSSKGVATIDQKQSDFEKEYEQYLKDNGLTKEDLSLTEYNDIANQTVGSKIINTGKNLLNKAGNWITSVFSGGSKESNSSAATATESSAASSYLGSGSGTDKKTSEAELKARIKEANENRKTDEKNARIMAKNNAKASKNSKPLGRGAIGYGMAQDDPSYASLNLGTLPDGSTATMANSGCGPTALANAVSATGGSANPGEIGMYAKRSGMLTQGGANEKLFTEGARKYGLQGQEISGMDSLDSSLSNGNPVIVSGKSVGYGSGSECNDGSCSLYTKAGHIVTVTGKTKDGNYTVDDGEGESIVSPATLQNGATHAYSMKRLGGRLPEGDRPGSGDVITASSSGTTPTNVVKDNGTTIQHGAYYFSQNGNSYSNMNLPPYKGTIGAIGCVHTSGTMAASTITGKAIDPGTFLNTYGNAATIGNLQKAGVKVTRYPANGSQSAGTVDGTQYLDTIISALKQRKMVMMYGIGNNGNMYKYGMGGSHCVLATGLDANGNIIINDPYAPNPPYGQGSTAQTAWAPTASSINPMHWAQVIETPDGKGASGQLDPNVSSGMSVSASGASGATTGATSGATAGTATAGATTGAEGTTGVEGESESPSATNLFNAIFNSVGNIFNKVGTRVMNSVISGKSYDQVKAEEEAAEANAAANGTATDTSVGYGMGMDKEPDPKIFASMPGNTMEEKKLAYYQQQIARKKAQEKLPKGGAYKDYPLLGRGPDDTETTISDSGDKLDQMILLLTDIRDNTGNMVSGGALGGTTKKKETGKNTNASKSGTKNDTQKKQSARDSAKSKLSSLNNGLNSDSLSRSNIRNTYAKIAAF